MKKITKICFIIGISLILIGCVLFVCIMTSLNWDFKKLSKGVYETNIHEISEEFNDISVTTDTADIKFVLSSDEKSKVECYEEEKAKHLVSVRNGKLVIEIDNQKDWYDYIRFGYDIQKIIIYLSKNIYNTLIIDEKTGNIEIPKDIIFDNANISLSTGNVDFNTSVTNQLKIKATTGDININSISAGTIDLLVSTGKITVSEVTCKNDIITNVSTGKVSLTNVVCENATSNGKNGDIVLENVIASNKFSIERSSGNVKINKSDASSIYIKTGTGDVEGSLLSNKVFLVETKTGSIDVPKTIDGGKCEIYTNTGNIKIRII